MVLEDMVVDIAAVVVFVAVAIAGMAFVAVDSSKMAAVEACTSITSYTI